MAAPACTKNYVLQLFAAALLLIALAGAIDYLVDPYGMNERFSIDGMNRIKPETETHERLYKASIIDRRQPSIIALGTSRTQRGISMDHPGWGGNIDDRYNAALVGANMYEILRYFEHANRTRRLRRVVLGLDLLAFNYYKKNQADFDEALLSSDEGQTEIDTALDRTRIYFSLTTLLAAKKTLADNCAGCYSPILSDGRQNPQAFELAWQQAGGHYQTFLRDDTVTVSYLHFPPPSRQFSLWGPDGESQFRYFERLLSIARRDHIDLHLFISPCHARQWEALRSAGLWPEFERWKDTLVQILAADSKRHPGEASFPLWDFSGYNSISTEPVPLLGDAITRMQWYWESSHYKKETGDLVLDRIFDHHKPGRTVPPDFGIKLTKNNFASRQSAIRADADRYRSTHLKDVALLDQLARQAQADREDRWRRNHPYEHTLPYYGATAQETNGQRSRFAIHY